MVAAIAAALSTVLAAFFAGVKVIIRELRPNGGNSMKDKVTSIDNKLSRLEERMDILFLQR